MQQGGITALIFILPWFWRSIARGAIYISATVSEGSLEGELPRLGTPFLPNWIRNILPDRVQLFVVLAPTLRKMAAMSKVLARCRGKVPGVTKNTQSAINYLC